MKAVFTYNYTESIEIPVPDTKGHELWMIHRAYDQWCQHPHVHLTVRIYQSGAVKQLLNFPSVEEMGIHAMWNYAECEEMRDLLFQDAYLNS